MGRLSNGLKNAHNNLQHIISKSPVKDTQRAEQSYVKFNLVIRFQWFLANTGEGGSSSATSPVAVKTTDIVICT